MLTSRDNIKIRDYLNEFSDRWPELWNDLFHKLNYAQFRVTVLWNLLKWNQPDKEEAEDMYRLIDLVRKTAYNVIPYSLEMPGRKNGPVGKVKTEVTVTEIECDGEL